LKTKVKTAINFPARPLFIFFVTEQNKKHFCSFFFHTIFSFIIFISNFCKNDRLTTIFNNKYIKLRYLIKMQIKLLNKKLI